MFDASGTNYLVPPGIPLATKQGRDIPNEQRTQRTRQEMEAALEMHRASHLSIAVRSLRSVYNCMGMVFASRRTRIGLEHLEMILHDDGYAQVGESEIDRGDLVVYRGNDGEFSHVGIIWQIGPYWVNNSRDVIVLSQWGADGEFIHNMHDVNPHLGVPAEFWTDRYGVERRH